MADRLDLEHGRDVRANLVCGLCGRTAGTVQGPNQEPTTGMTLRVQDPGHVDAVSHLRCPYCSGRLWLQHSENIHVDRRPLTADEFRPRRGRPPKIVRAS
jgi:hypothetical protein